MTKATVFDFYGAIIDWKAERSFWMSEKLKLDGIYCEIPKKKSWWKRFFESLEDTRGKTAACVA
jgi:hypothetical protein